MRKGEALTLTWGDIDFHRKEIKVAKWLNRKRPKKGGDVILTSHPETPSSFGCMYLKLVVMKLQHLKIVRLIDKY